MSAKLTSAIQEALLAILCYDGTPGGAKTVRALVPHRTFDPYFRDLAEAADQFIAKHDTAPGEHTLDLIDQLKAKSPDKADVYDRIFRSLEQTRATINRDYVLAQARNFGRHQRVMATVGKVLEITQAGREGYLDEAEAAMLMVGKQQDLLDSGLLLNDPDQATAFLDDDDEYFETGIPILDRYNLGPVRKGLHVFLAGPNKGKTWWAIHLGKHALLHRHRVLHVTLEMSERKIAKRYVQALFAVSKRDEVTHRAKFVLDELGRLAEITTADIKNRMYLLHDNIRAHLKRKLRPLARRPRLYIKQFPTGSLTIPQLKAYLDHLEGVRDFIPDLVIVDYPDIMQVDAKNQRIDLGRIYQQLRGLGVERNMAMVAMSQANRLGEDAKTLKGKHLAEDYSKFGIADTILTYNQTEDEFEQGLARLVALKSRDDLKGVQILISQAYNIGQFCMESVRMHNANHYWSMIKTNGDDDDDEQTDE